MNKKFVILLLSFMLFFSLFANIAYAQIDDSSPIIKVLYLNSYHKGYKWSDNILEGIESQLMLDQKNIELDVEYMDTQRITGSNYMHKLQEIYTCKFKNIDYDIIISSDDAAFNFLIDNAEDLFPNTPIVFCGLNYFEDSMLDNQLLMTGVSEGYDIEGTINLALDLQPNLKNIYYINDTTITGNLIDKELEKTKIAYEDTFNFIKLDGSSLNEIIYKSKHLPENSIILFLVYSKDNAGNLFEYDESIAQLENHNSVPIYGVWNFHLGHGIVGGTLTSGYSQGETAANLALRILSGEAPSNIPVITKKTNHYKFDYNQLNKFNIPLDHLPSDSLIINHEVDSKKRILILNSYHKGLKWTDDIGAGIMESLEDKADDIDFIYEYMDAKRNTDPIYLHKVREFLKEKYMNETFDAIIATDDQAFQFISDYSHMLFKDVPVVFCGVNYFENSMLAGKENITGVVESNNFKSTLDLALQLHPNLERIIIINDTTLTGKSNRKVLDSLAPNYEDRVDFEFWSDVNMSFIQKNVKTLGENDIILLLTFNQDKSYNNFSFEEAIELISKDSTVPIYGSWDFYMGDGLFGGMLTRGLVQGKVAGNMVSQILDGTKPKDIPIIKNNLGVYMFDYNLLKKFNIHLSALPKNSIVINRPFSLKDLYNSYRVVFISICLLIITIFILSCIVYLLLKNSKIRKIAAEKERLYAMTDVLTGIPNRRACFDELEKFVENAKINDASFTIAFLDINRLKYVNDTFGHLEGDELIKNVCRLIQENIKHTDTLYRMGGDEFVIIFNKATQDQCLQTWKKVNDSIDSFNVAKTKPYSISISVGFMEYDPERHHNIDELIDEADKKMYKNKMSYRKKNNLTEDQRN